MKKRKLIIDAGHGGKDSGGGSNQHWLEKDMVLKISLYQYERFKELGVPVQLTRSTDIELPPVVRTNIVKSSNADDCISNHINAGGGDGVETIHSIYSEGKLADMVAEAIVKAGQNLRRVFTKTLSYNSKRDYYYMHRDTGSVNTVIVEYGFADSKKDDIEQLLKHWKDYAEAVVKAYCEFAGYEYKIIDDNKPSSWAVKSMEKAMKFEYSPGKFLTDGTNPKEPMSFERFMVILDRLGLFNK